MGTATSTRYVHRTRRDWNKVPSAIFLSFFSLVSKNKNGEMGVFARNNAQISPVRAQKTQNNASIVYLRLFFIQHTEHHELSVYEFCF